MSINKWFFTDLLIFLYNTRTIYFATFFNITDVATLNHESRNLVFRYLDELVFWYSDELVFWYSDEVVFVGICTFLYISSKLTLKGHDTVIILEMWKNNKCTLNSTES